MKPTTACPNCKSDDYTEDPPGVYYCSACHTVWKAGHWPRQLRAGEAAQLMLAGAWPPDLEPIGSRAQPN